MEKKNPINNVNCVTERIENCNNNNNNNNTGGLKVKRTRRSAPRGSPMQRSSAFRGVTKHRGTGRFEAHLWDKNCWNESQNKRGKQVYLGAYDMENAAARAYDIAALKYWGEKTKLNFPVSEYEEELKEMEAYTKEEYIGIIRRRSSGFSRGASKYRGVARHHHNGRWEARIGRVLGNKYLYLGTFATEEEAATAYDKAAILHRGFNAITNFDRSRYFESDSVTNVPSNTDQPSSSDQAVHTETWYSMPIHSLPQPPKNDITIAFTDGLETTLADDNNERSITTSFEYPYDYQWQFPEFQGCILNDVHSFFEYAGNCFEYEEMGWFPSPLYQY